MTSHENKMWDLNINYLDGTIFLNKFVETCIGVRTPTCKKRVTFYLDESMHDFFIRQRFDQTI